MLKTRVMPCLLMRKRGLVKTVRFRSPTYVGDPINTVRIFNEREVDELILLDIEVGVKQRPPQFGLIEEIAGECFMPLCYGGGVRTIDDFGRLYAAGVEKVAINSAAVIDSKLISRAAEKFGSQSVVVSIDVKRNWRGRYQVLVSGGRKKTGLDPIEHARSVAKLGAGEILLTAIDRDGFMAGYDLELTKGVSCAVDLPVIACGGAGSVEDFRSAVFKAGSSAVAAGSIFVFQGPHRSVLVNFPAKTLLRELFTS